MLSAVFLSTVNVSVATGLLVTYLYSTVPINEFFSSRGFLDIEKSVLLELKGVKIIRSYRDFIFFI